MELLSEQIEKLKTRHLSYSSLKEFRRSPEHFVHYVFGPKKKTKALTTGSLIDKIILNPDGWEATTAIMPPKPMLLKECEAQYGKKDARTHWDQQKADYDGFVAANKDKLLVSQQDVDKAKLIAERVFNNPKSSGLLARITNTQIELRWDDRETGLKMVGFGDGTGDSIAMELKTCKDASPRKFLNDAIKYDYPFQLGIYAEGFRERFFQFPEFWYLTVETVAPYGILVHKVDPDWIEYGKKEFRKTIDKMKYCIDKNAWGQSYEFHQPLGYNILELPYYLRKELEE